MYKQQLRIVSRLAVCGAALILAAPVSAQQPTATAGSPATALPDNRVPDNGRHADRSANEEGPAALLGVQRQHAHGHGRRNGNLARAVDHSR